MAAGANTSSSQIRQLITDRSGNGLAEHGWDQELLQQPFTEWCSHAKQYLAYRRQQGAKPVVKHMFVVMARRYDGKSGPAWLFLGLDGANKLWVWEVNHDEPFARNSSHRTHAGPISDLDEIRAVLNTRHRGLQTRGGVYSNAPYLTRDDATERLGRMRSYLRGPGSPLKSFPAGNRASR